MGPTFNYFTKRPESLRGIVSGHGREKGGGGGEGGEAQEPSPSSDPSSAVSVDVEKDPARTVLVEPPTVVQLLTVRKTVALRDTVLSFYFSSLSLSLSLSLFLCLLSLSCF